MIRPLVYISGPYTGGKGPVNNTARAMQLADQFFHDGIVWPHTPHLSLYQQMLSNLDYETWLEYDLDYIISSRVDGVYRMKGDSPGADREVLEAMNAEIPVFHDIKGLYDWAQPGYLRDKLGR